MQTALSQHNGGNVMPYVAVGTDQKGSGCWIVVEGEKTTRFATGREAFQGLSAAIGKQQETGPYEQ